MLNTKDKSAVRSIARGIRFWVLVVWIFLAAACAGQQTAQPTPPPQPTRTRIPTAIPTRTPIPYTAEEIFTQAMESLDAVTAMKYMQSTTITGGGVGAIGDVKGKYKNPDQHMLQLNFGGNAIEVLSLSPDAFFMRSPGIPDWKAVTQAKAMEMVTLFSFMNPFDLDKLQGLASDLHKLDNQQVDGADSYHVQFVLDLEKYIEQLGLSKLGPIDLNQATGVGQIWVGSDDLRLRQMQFDITSTKPDEPINAKEKWTFYDYNQPVEILAP